MAKLYFFGAGATKAIAHRAPLNNEILEFAFNRTGYNEIKKELKETKIFLNKVFYKIRDKIPPLEDILSIIDFNLHQKTIPLKGYNHQDFINIRNNLVRIIAIVLKNNLINLDFNATDSFVEKIDENDSIISTNYDIVIDNSLLSKRKNTNYGVKIRQNIFPIKYASGHIRATTLDRMYLNYGSIKLLKLHGSLNWLYCPKCDEIDITLTTKGVAEYLNKEYELLCLNQYCTSNYEPLIVTPTKFKIYDNKILKKIWEISIDCISKADEIIFIGYSLPQADTEIRCMLINGINKAKIKPKISFVDKPGGSNDIDNYRHLFGDVNHMPIGFLEYVDTMD